jgi:beta-glucosidase
MKRFFTLPLVLALSLRVFGHSATEPAPRGDQGWKDRQELLNKRVAEGGAGAQVLFIGDSITQGWEGDGKEVWAHYYSHRKAINLGIGGDRTQHVLWRLDHGNLEGSHPKVVVVMIGTNNSNGEDNTPGQIVDGVNAIVKKLEEKLPEAKILLLAIFPRGENFNPQRGKILQVNQVLRRIADNQRVYWADFGHEFVSADGTIPRELMPDYLHLSSQAYAVWAESIEGQLSTLLGDERVKPISSRTAPNAGLIDLSGEWIWTITGPNGDPVSAPLILRQQGATVTGKFARGQDAWLEIQNGAIQGNEFSWVVKRNRPTGETMEYQMSGKLDNGEIKGVAKTKFNGADTTVPWSAKRK